MNRLWLIGCMLAALGAQAQEHPYPPQVSSEGGIKVTATPQNLAPGAKTWDFAMVIETHTGALGDSLTESSVLIVDGTKYRPLSWRGDPPGGHHRKGVLSFAAISPTPASIELQMTLGNDAAPRSFTWRLK